MAMYQNQLHVLSRGGINAKTVAVTTIDTTENGTQRFVPLYFAVVCTAATSITDGPTISFGTNSATYDNIQGAIDLGSTYKVANDVALLQPIQGGSMLTAIKSVAANTDIKLNISGAATGTSMTIRADIIGYYV